MPFFRDGTERPSGESSESRNLTYEWGPNKSESNIDKHGIGFVAVTRFEWDTAVVKSVMLLMGTWMIVFIL